MEYYAAIKKSRVDFYVWVWNKLQDTQFSEKIHSASGFLVYAHMHLCVSMYKKQGNINI